MAINRIPTDMIVDRQSGQKLSEQLADMATDLNQRAVNITKPPYNAKGDSVQDALPIFQQAINDLIAKGGGIIDIPKTSGIYILNSGQLSINTTVPILIRGLGNPKVKTNYNGNGGIKLGNGTWNNTGVSLQGITFLGNQTLTNQSLLTLDNVSACRVIDCTFQDAGLFGINNLSPDNYFHNVTFVNCKNSSGGAFGIGAGDSRGSGVFVSNLKINGCSNGLFIQNYAIDMVKVDNAIIQGNEIGIRIKTTIPLLIANFKNVYFEGNTVKDVLVGEGTASPNVRNIKFEDCQWYVTKTGETTEFKKVNTLTILNCYWGSPSGFTGGLDIDNSVNEVKIDSNRFEGYTTHVVNSSSGVSINNKIAGGATYTKGNNVGDLDDYPNSVALKSPDGSKWKQTINNTGTVTWVKL